MGNFSNGALELQTGKPGVNARAFYTKRKGGILMDLIAKFVLTLKVGTFTVVITIRKGR